MDVRKRREGGESDAQASGSENLRSRDGADVRRTSQSRVRRADRRRRRDAERGKGFKSDYLAGIEMALRNNGGRAVPDLMTLELNFMGSGKQKGISRGCSETKGRGGIRRNKPPVRKTCGIMMVPTPAARRSRGCAVRTDVDAGTRKGGKVSKVTT